MALTQQDQPYTLFNDYKYLLDPASQPTPGGVQIPGQHMIFPPTPQYGINDKIGGLFGVPAQQLQQIASSKGAPPSPEVEGEESPYERNIGTGHNMPIPLDTIRSQTNQLLKLLQQQRGSAAGPPVHLAGDVVYPNPQKFLPQGYDSPQGDRVMQMQSGQLPAGYAKPPNSVIPMFMSGQIPIIPWQGK